MKNLVSEPEKEATGEASTLPPLETTPTFTPEQSSSALHEHEDEKEPLVKAI